MLIQPKNTQTKHFCLLISFCIFLCLCIGNLFLAHRICIWPKKSSVLGLEAVGVDRSRDKKASRPYRKALLIKRAKAELCLGRRTITFLEFGEKSCCAVVAVCLRNNNGRRRVGRQLGLGGPVPRCAPHCLHGDVHLWCASAHLVYWYIVQPTVQTLGICPVPLGVVCVLLDILFWILVLSRYSPTLKMSI